MSYITTQFNKAFKTSKPALVDHLTTKAADLRAQQAVSEDMVNVHLDLATQEKSRATKAQTQAKAIEQATTILEKAGVTV